MRVPLRYRAETRDPAPPGGSDGTWHGTYVWAEQTLYLMVAGDAAAPDPALEATLWQIVDGFDEIARAIEAFATALLPDGRVRLSSRDGGWFAARNCGFARGGFGFGRVDVVDRERPSVAIVDFVTGEPDGYVCFAVTLDGGRPIAIIAEV